MHRSVANLKSPLLLPGVVWGALAFAVHKVGVVGGWYGTFPWFQNVTHAASASGVAVILGLVALHLGFRGRDVVVIAIVGTALGALGWEAVEYLGLLDAYGMYFHFHDVEDAAVDMASNAVGTAVALTALWIWTDLEPPATNDDGDGISGQPGRQHANE